MHARMHGGRSLTITLNSSTVIPTTKHANADQIDITGMNEALYDFTTKEVLALLYTPPPPSPPFMFHSPSYTGFFHHTPFLVMKGGQNPSTVHHYMGEKTGELYALPQKKCLVGDEVIQPHPQHTIIVILLTLPCPCQ